MDFIVVHFKGIMLVAGAVTLSMISAAMAPRLVFGMLLGEAPETPLELMLARNWGVLIGLTGAALLYGAYYIQARTIVLAVAGISKLTFIALTLTHRPLRLRALLPVAVDGVFVVLFAIYLKVAYS